MQKISLLIKDIDANYGARPLKRAIQKYLEDPIAEEIIKAELVEGDTIVVNFEKETSTLKISVTKVNSAHPLPRLQLSQAVQGRRRKSNY